MNKEKMRDILGVVLDLAGPILVGGIILVGFGSIAYTAYPSIQEWKNEYENRVVIVCNSNNAQDCSAVVDFDEDWFRNCYNAQLKDSSIPYRYCGQYYVMDNPDKEGVAETTNQDVEQKDIGVQNIDLNKESMEETFIHTYAEAHMSGLKAYGDPDLITYYKEYLQQQCPFYQPNGIQYRECLLELIDDYTERASDITNAQRLYNESYCSSGAEKSAEKTAIGYADLYNTCMAYKVFTSALKTYRKNEMDFITGYLTNYFTSEIAN